MIELYTILASQELSMCSPRRTLGDRMYRCNIEIVLFPNYCMITAAIILGTLISKSTYHSSYLFSYLPIDMPTWYQPLNDIILFTTCIGTNIST